MTHVKSNKLYLINNNACMKLKPFNVNDPFLRRDGVPMGLSVADFNAWYLLPNIFNSRLF